MVMYPFRMLSAYSFIASRTRRSRAGPKPSLSRRALKKMINASVIPWRFASALMFRISA